jgi:hypothetical protein
MLHDLVTAIGIVIYVVGECYLAYSFLIYCNRRLGLTQRKTYFDEFGMWLFSGFGYFLKHDGKDPERFWK